MTLFSIQLRVFIKMLSILFCSVNVRRFNKVVYIVEYMERTFLFGEM